MSKNLSSLPEDIYKVLEGKSLFDPSVISRFGDTLQDILSKRLTQEDWIPTLRMSNLGRPLRQLYYELNGFEGEKIEGKTLVKFAYGDICEALVIALAEASGHEVSRFQEEVSVDGVLGHIDLVLDGVLVDVKSCSSYSFSKFKDGTLFDEGQDAFGYVGQLCGYAHALKLPAAWVAFDKVSGEICILDLPQTLVDSYNVQEKIAEARSVVGSSTVPERCYPSVPDGKSGNMKLQTGCSYCSHRFVCWSDSNNGEGLKVYYYANGPRYLSVVTREPKVESYTNNNNFPVKEKGTN